MEIFGTKYMQFYLCMQLVLFVNIYQELQDNVEDLLEIFYLFLFVALAYLLELSHGVPKKFSWPMVVFWRIFIPCVTVCAYRGSIIEGYCNKASLILNADILFLTLRWRELFDTTVSEFNNLVWCIISPIVRYLSTFPWRRIFAYFLVVTLHAVFLTYILCELFTLLVIWSNSLPLHLQSYFVDKPVDNSFDGHRMIELSSKMYKEERHRIFAKHEDHSEVELTVLQDSVHQHGEEFHRFIGEDVRFRCEFHTTSNFNFYFESSFFWKKSSKRLNLPSPRHTMDITVDPQPIDLHNDNRKWYHTTADLSVFLIEPEDYGDYMLIWHTVRSVGSFISIARQTTLSHVRVGDIDVCFFRLTETKESVEYIEVPLGGMYDFQSAKYRAFASDGDVTVEHTINNSPMDTVCTALPLGGCFPSIYIYRAVWMHTNMAALPFVAVTSIEGSEEFHSRSLSCMCAKSVGTYEIHFYRTFYNRITGAKQLVKVTHPKRHILTPKDVLTVSNSSTNYEYLLKSIMNEHNEKQALCDYMHNNEHFKWFLLFWIETAVISCTVFILALVFEKIVKFYNRILVIHIGRFALEGTFRPGTLPCAGETPLGNVHDKQTPPQHDVYISYTEEDRLFVTRKLIPYMENNCGLKVCVAERDFSPGYNLKNYSLEINRSNKVVVVLSEDYIQNGECNGFQLTAIILQNVYGRIIPPEHVLFLKYRPCRIPMPLFTIPRLDWGSTLSEEDKMILLKKWAGDSIFRVR